MKTKHILFTLALGTAFAACTSEENFQVAPGNDGTDAMLSIRPVVGSELIFGGDEAATRLALGSKYRPAWGETDQVGAAIIDVPAYTSEEDYATKIKGGSKAIQLYDILNSYGCNNAFTTSDGGATWQAEHPMVEGNYLFYAPYQEGLSLRTPLVVEVPRVQDATSEKSALEEFYNGEHVVQVGYKFITNDERQKPTVTLYNIFAYPQFTITNNFNGYLFETGVSSATSTTKYNGAIRVDSVQFLNVGASRAPKSNVLVVGGQLSHSDNVGASSGAKNATTATAGVINEMKQKTNGFAADGDWWSLDKMLNDVKTTDLLSLSNTITAGRHGQTDVITTLVVNQTVDYGKSIDLYCVMPAYKFNFNDDQLMAKLFVTINGVQYEIYDAKFNGGTPAPTTATLSANADLGYLFDAKNNNGLSSLSLMAGQRLPAEALRVEGDEYQQKTDVKDLLTINLTGGVPGTSPKVVQIAVRKGASNEGAATTDDLINMIKNAANGTNWVEGSTSNATQKGFTIAPMNTVEINSELIDVLATNNQNEGGAFTISTVVPISNDVKVTAVTGTKVTLQSNTGKTYDITLSGAVTDNNDGSGKYVVVDSNTPSGYNASSVVIVKGTLNSSAAAVKSLHVMSTGTATLSAAFAANNIRIDGTLTASDNVTAKELYNAGTMNITKVVSSKDATVTNDGTINTQANTASVTINAGTGKVVVNEANTATAIVVATAAKQDVIYSCTSTLGTEQITKAVTIPAVNAIQANGPTTLAATDMAKFGNIKKIITSSAMTFGAGTYDMSGFTIEIGSAVTLTGAGVTSTTINGVKVVLGTNNLTLATVAVANASVQATTGKVIADGISATWNGGASGQN